MTTNERINEVDAPDQPERLTVDAMRVRLRADQERVMPMAAAAAAAFAGQLRKGLAVALEVRRVGGWMPGDPFEFELAGAGAAMLATAHRVAEVDGTPCYVPVIVKSEVEGTP